MGPWEAQSKTITDRRLERGPGEALARPFRSCVGLCSGGVGGRRYQHRCLCWKARLVAYRKSPAQGRASLASVRGCRSWCMLTCCATAAVTPWPMRGTTLGVSRIGWATDRSSTRHATPNSAQHPSAISGADYWTAVEAWPHEIRLCHRHWDRGRLRVGFGAYHLVVLVNVYHGCQPSDFLQGRLQGFICSRRERFQPHPLRSYQGYAGNMIPACRSSFSTRLYR